MGALVKELGFESVQEWQHLVATADLSTPEKLIAFETWKHEDGTKQGLLALAEPIVFTPEQEAALDADFEGTIRKMQEGIAKSKERLSIRPTEEIIQLLRGYQAEVQKQNARPAHEQNELIQTALLAGIATLRWVLYSELSNPLTNSVTRGESL